LSEVFVFRNFEVEEEIEGKKEEDGKNKNQNRLWQF
jgi:hypothetical protein